MDKYNLKNETEELTDVVELLKKDTIDIEERVRRINEIVNKLDRTVWDSPEKKQIEEELFPFLEKNVKTVPQILEECNKVLEEAKEKYKENDLTLKQGANKLES